VHATGPCPTFSIAIEREEGADALTVTVSSALQGKPLEACLTSIPRAPAPSPANFRNQHRATQETR